jgi:hypothetical protein
MANPEWENYDTKSHNRAALEAEFRAAAMELVNEANETFIGGRLKELARRVLSVDERLKEASDGR